jgi:hypothetical protein
MGGSGGGGFIPPSSRSIGEKLRAAQEAERERLDSDVNELLGDFLKAINDRDVETIQRRLEEIGNALGEDANLDTLLFGGSVAKHTFVDGLSDVDALVVLDRADTRGISPQRLIERFRETLESELGGREVVAIEAGRLAVTVRYSSGEEIQLLPAIRSGASIAIPDARGRGWNQTDPGRFQQEITQQNRRLNGALVPTIKLVKSLVSDLPQQQQLSGYHAEALGLDAAKSYRGKRTPQALLLHTLDHAAKRVLRPIRDVTGQSRVVDETLGPANSAERRLISQALSGIKRRLDSATSLHQWKAMFGLEGE